MPRPLLAALLLLPATVAAQQGGPNPLEPEYRARREALQRQVGDAVIVVRGAPEPAADYQSFAQNPPFAWLTGINEAGATLVLVRQGATARQLVFVEPRNPAREVWTGSRLGAAAVAARTGMEARDADDLPRVLDSLVATKLPVAVVAYAGEGATAEVLSTEQQFVQALKKRHGDSLRVRDVGMVLAQLRGTKSANELALIRRAIDITVRAHREALGAMAPGMNEFEIQALIEYTFRRNGADRPSFATTVGSGPNATTLHYNADDRVMRAGELAVMDIGASYKGYAADVTRTLPVSGTFTADQKAVYQVVRDAQQAAEQAAVLGARAQLMSVAATKVIAAGLARLGLIESDTATYECAARAGAVRRCPQYTMYYMHGLGHGIGLEVHDPDQYYFSGVLQPGSAFTIEPGIYVRADVLDVLPDTPANAALRATLGAAVKRYANIGVRIEDDYFVTERGVEWVSKAPREIAEIEALMKKPWRGPAARNAKMVEEYGKPVP
jgi:Xaa-Pro aminopeptidase